MALTTVDKWYFWLWRLWNRIVRPYFSYDIYGIRIFGIQMTPKRVADILKRDNGGRFSENQLRHFRVYLMFNSFYVFIPRFFGQAES
ncbi:hypothetical protein GCM10027343_16770 [Noviherbaspirillum agri]